MFKSNAEWPKNTLGFDGDITTDNHDTEEQAQGVCHLLQRNGFGGNGEIFPIRVWVTQS